MTGRDLPKFLLWLRVQGVFATQLVSYLPRFLLLSLPVSVAVTFFFLTKEKNGITL